MAAAAAVERAKGARNRIGWLSHQPSLHMGGLRIVFQTGG
jgi:hypothetical protein